VAGNSQSVTTICEDCRRSLNCFGEAIWTVFDILNNGESRGILGCDLRLRMEGLNQPEDLTLARSSGGNKRRDPDSPINTLNPTLRTTIHQEHPMIEVLLLRWPLRCHTALGRNVKLRGQIDGFQGTACRDMCEFKIQAFLWVPS